MSEQKIYYFRENLFQSVLADLTTFGFLCGSVWFNEKFVNGSTFLNAVILVMLLVFLISRANSKKREFHSTEALIKHLQGE